MRPRCPVCKKLFWCDWPNMWAYKRDGVYLCSWGCLRKYDERKEAGDMAYRKIKKDGTPAKIPGGKKKEEPKVEITEQMEEDCVELVYDPSIAEEYRREQAQKKANEQARAEADEEMNRLKIFREIDMEPLEVCGVRSRVLKDGVYTRNTAGNAMILSGLSMADDHLGLAAGNWKRLAAEIMLALEQLGIKEGDPEDYTGNNGPL